MRNELWAVERGPVTLVGEALAQFVHRMRVPGESSENLELTCAELDESTRTSAACWP